MAHPAQKDIDAARKKRSHPGAVEGERARVGRLDRKSGDAVDASSWRPPAPHKEWKHEVPGGELDGYARGGGIHIKASHKGLLHRDLGVASGEPIPTKKLESAKANASPAEKKRITFAENAKKFKHD